MHSKRLIVAIITLPLLFLYVTKLPPVYFLFLMICLSGLAQWEFNSMYKSNPTISTISILIGTSLIAIPYFFKDCMRHLLADMGLYMLVLILGFLILTTIRLFIVKNPESALRDLSPALVGIAYIPTLMVPQWHLRLLGSEWIVLLYACVWASDSLAYYIGKGIGRTKLYYEVSPNKTMEGAVGSLIGGILSVLLISWLMGINDKYLFVGLSGLAKLTALGLLIGFITIIGDLVESMFKRDADIKDSGVLLPGHGGFLDKLDGSLFAGPAMYIYLLVIL
ncbi:MAG: phosphatidate cytidylyltransferase [Thermodesulfovibrionales bacterium]|nr:phosphatidate cytidylyltransferase [Thermodesulfovibrionales bacterium]